MWEETMQDARDVTLEKWEEPEVRSKPYWFSNAVEAPLWIENSISPTGQIFPNHTDWSLQFNKQVSWQCPDRPDVELVHEYCNIVRCIITL